jgi:hypothetical protein
MLRLSQRLVESKPIESLFAACVTSAPAADREAAPQRTLKGD